MSGEETKRVTLFRVAVAAILVVSTGIAIVSVTSSEQPDDAPDYYNQSEAAFYEDCKSDGGTVLVKFGEDPPEDIRCKYENGTKRDYTTP